MTPVDTVTLMYWIHGDGEWMNRWHCSGGDLAACVAMCSACLLMFTSYLVYAAKNHYELRLVKESSFRNHLIRLRNVFLVCGTIHVLDSVICWFIPIYYIIATAMLINTIQCVYLIISKDEILAIKQYTAGSSAIEHVREAKIVIARVVAEKQHEYNKELLNRLEEVKSALEV